MLCLNAACDTESMRPLTFEKRLPISTDATTTLKQQAAKSRPETTMTGVHEQRLKHDLLSCEATGNKTLNSQLRLYPLLQKANPVWGCNQNYDPIAHPLQ